MHIIEKGAEYNLMSHDGALRNIRIVFSWEMDAVKNEFGDSHITENPFDIDASCFMLNNFKKIRSEHDFVFYNNPTSEDKEIIHLNDTEIADVPGINEVKGHEVITVALDKVPYDIAYLSFSLSIHNATERQQNFGMIKAISMNVFDADSNISVAEMHLGEADLAGGHAVLVGEISRVAADWIFKSEGVIFEAGLVQIARDFDVDVRES